MNERSHQASGCSTSTYGGGIIPHKLAKSLTQFPISTDYPPFQFFATALQNILPKRLQTRMQLTYLNNN
jgi:hypothetical protein